MRRCICFHFYIYFCAARSRCPIFTDGFTVLFLFLFLFLFLLAHPSPRVQTHSTVLLAIQTGGTESFYFVLLLVLFALASLLLLFRDRLSCLSCRCCRIPRAMGKDLKERRPSRIKRIAGVAISQRRDSDSDSDSQSRSDSDRSRSGGDSMAPAEGGIDPAADHTALSIESQLGPASPTGHHNPASPSQCDLQMMAAEEK